MPWPLGISWSEKKNFKSRRIAQCSGGVKSKRVCAAIRTPPIIYNSENCTTNTQYCPSQKRARWWFPCCAVGSFINCVTPCMIMITANLFQKAIKYQFATSISTRCKNIIKERITLESSCAFAIAFCAFVARPAISSK